MESYLCLIDILSCNTRGIPLLPLSLKHVVEEREPIEQEAQTRHVGLHPGSRQVRRGLIVAVHVHSITIHGAARLSAWTMLDIIVAVKLELVTLAHFSREIPILELENVLIDVCVELHPHAILRTTAGWCAGTAIVHHHHAAAHGTTRLRIHARHHLYGGARWSEMIELILFSSRCKQNVGASHVSIRLKRALIVERRGAGTAADDDLAATCRRRTR